jgi:DNA primase
MRRMGARWVALCPLPGHDERTPSFMVFPEQNSWYCFGACQRGGDVVDLAAATWGYGEEEMAAAAANLLHEFGLPIPERPASWHRKMGRQQPVRDELERIKTDSLRRRLFRILAPTVSGIADDEEREAEAEHLWRELTPLAARMIRERGMDT